MKNEIFLSDSHGGSRVRECEMGTEPDEYLVARRTRRTSGVAQSVKLFTLFENH